MSQSNKISKEFGAVHAAGDSVQLLYGSGALGAVNLYSSVTELKSTGAATATLADGKIGQIKTIVQSVDTGDVVLTPTNLQAGTTITFADAGDAITLVFLNAAWHVVSNNGSVVA